MNMCIYKGGYIGIEAFTTLKDGMLINIPDKLKELREASHNRELFCECGCKRNVMVVAGEKQLKEQHFRLWPNQDDDMFLPCQAENESDVTRISKTYVKGWLDYVWNLSVEDIRYRVPICDIKAEENRRFEFTYYIEKKQFGVCYARRNTYLNDEKIEILTKHMRNHMLYITDIDNGGIEYQYPEYASKVQSFQGFCALLDIYECENVNDVWLYIVNYQKNYRDVWEEVSICRDLLVNYSLSDTGELLYKDTPVKEMVATALSHFEKRQAFLKADEKKKAEEQRIARERQERIRQMQRIADEKRAREALEARKQEEQKAAELLVQKEAENTKRQEEHTRRMETMSLDDYFREYPKTGIIYEYISGLSMIKGAMMCNGAGKANPSTAYVSISITEINFDKVKSRILIKDANGDLCSIYTMEDIKTMPQIAGDEKYYLLLGLRRTKEENLISKLRDILQCYKK